MNVEVDPDFVSKDKFAFLRFRKQTYGLGILVIILNICLLLLTIVILFVARDHNVQLSGYYDYYGIKYEKIFIWLNFVTIFGIYALFLIIVGTVTILLGIGLLYFPCYFLAALLVASQLGIYFFLHPGNKYIENTSKNRFKTLLLEYDRDNNRNEMDAIQRTYTCCGNESPNDWKNMSKLIPGSCCGKEITEICENDDIKERKGCYKQISSLLSHEYSLLSTLTIISLFLQIVIFVLAGIFFYVRHIFYDSLSSRLPPKPPTSSKPSPDPSPTTSKPPVPTKPMTTKPPTTILPDEPCFPWGHSNRRKSPASPKERNKRSPPPKYRILYDKPRNPPPKPCSSESIT